MKRLLIHITTGILLLFLSCDEQIVIVKCPECTPDEPIETLVEVKTERLGFDVVVITVYEGNLEDNIVLNQLNSSGPYAEFRLKLNRKYTITARYITENGSIVTAVDSVYPRVKYETELCEEPCYYVYDRKVNLSLKRSNY